jgi:hypothetical protein
MNTFNEKTEPVRNVINTVKDTTTSTIQHGKETVNKKTKIRQFFISIYRFLMSLIVSIHFVKHMYQEV